MAKVAFEVAKEELAKFAEVAGIELDFEIDELESFKKDKKDSDTEDLPTIKKILKNICDGIVIITDSSELCLKLKYPLTKGIDLKELVYSNRMNVKEQNKKLNQYKQDDSDGRLVAVTAARTGQNTGIIESLDTVDYNNAALITSLFL